MFLQCFSTLSTPAHHLLRIPLQCLGLIFQAKPIPYLLRNRPLSLSLSTTALLANSSHAKCTVLPILLHSVRELSLHFAFLPTLGSLTFPTQFNTPPSVPNPALLADSPCVTYPCCPANPRFAHLTLHLIASTPPTELNQ